MEQEAKEVQELNLAKELNINKKSLLLGMQHLQILKVRQKLLMIK